MACQVLSLYYDPANMDKNVESLLDTVNDHFITVNFLEESGKNKYTGVHRGEFVLNLIQGVLANVSKLDSRISDFLHGNYNVSSLDSVLLQSLRLAYFEMTSSDISKKVVVSEYVDLVAEFCDKACIAFANGVLDRMASTMAERVDGAEDSTD
jgi:transcription termination factor NusB